MENRCDHFWIYDGRSCCGHRLRCVKLGCGRATHIKNMIGESRIGDFMNLIDGGEGAERIELTDRSDIGGDY